MLNWAQEVPDSTLRLLETSIIEVIRMPSGQEIQNRKTTAGTVVLEEEIQQRSPEDLGDLTSSFSGVFMRSYGGAGGLKTLNARGLGSQHFLVVANSQAMLFNQMGSANLGDVQVDGLSLVSYSVGGTDSWRLPALSKTYSGVLSLRYMDDASLVYRKRVQIQILGASFGRVKFSGSWLKSTEKFALFAQAYGYRLDGDYPFQFQHGLIAVDGNRLHNQTREAAMRFGGVRKLNEKNRVHASIQYLNAHRELPGAIVFYHPDQYQELTNQQINGNLQHSRTAERLELSNYTNFSQTQTTYTNAFLFQGTEVQFYKENNLDAGHNGTWSNKDFDVNWSGQYIFSNLLSNRADILLPKRHRGILNMGAVYQTGDLKIRADIPVQFLSDQLWQHPNQNRVLLTPSLGLNKSWTKPSYSTVLRASAGQFARVATFSEMYYGQMGNPDLRPEVSQMLNFGVHHGRNSDYWQFNFGADFFGGMVQDKIIAIPTQNLFVWSVRNVQTVRTYGFDAIAMMQYSWRFYSSLGLNLKSSLNVAHDISDVNSSTYGHQIPYTPYWLHSGELIYKFKSLSVAYQCSFNDFRFVLGENIAANVLDEFHLHDVRLSYEGKFKQVSKHAYRVHAKCNNLLNSQYQVMRGFPMPGRNFEIGFTWMWK